MCKNEGMDELTALMSTSPILVRSLCLSEPPLSAPFAALERFLLKGLPGFLPSGIADDKSTGIHL